MRLIRNLIQYTFEVANRLSYVLALFKFRLMVLTLPLKISLPDDFIFDTERSSPRGRADPNGSHYSFAYELQWEELPDSIKLQVKNLDSFLKIYFGGEYLIQEGRIWRNHSIPKEFESLDLFSQVWHYDKVVDYKNLSLFILLHDTTVEHGPFEYIDNASYTDRIDGAESRIRDLSNKHKIIQLTGARGDSLLFATGAMAHRAGIPKAGHTRDLFCISFFPKYSKIGRPSKQLIDLD
jgi:hypothetical protein